MAASTQTRRTPGARLVHVLTSTAVVLVMVGCAAWLLPSAFGYDRYVITGGSMSGTFEKGSIAFEEEVPVEQLRVGDVITYQPPADSGTSALVTHRIVSIRPGEAGLPLLRTKGDANASKDPWRFSLTGSSQPVVRWTVPYAGHAFIALADREQRMLIIGGPAAVVALLALRDLVRALRRTKPDAPSSASIPAQLPRRPAPHGTPV
jgi:signal peptidase I